MRRGPTAHVPTVPDDREIWRRHVNGTLSLSNISGDRGTQALRRVLKERGWTFARTRKQYHLHTAPCATCCARFTVRKDQRVRQCPTCLPAVEPDPNKRLYQRELAAYRKRQAKHEAELHAKVQERIARNGEAWDAFAMPWTAGYVHKPRRRRAA